MKLMTIMNGNMETLPFFAGDLYVTVFGGRTRRIGVLLGKGYTYPEAREILAGVTLESVAIATLTGEAIRKMEARGVAKVSDFPLLMHIDGIINRKEEVNVPWLTFEQESTY